MVPPDFTDQSSSKANCSVPTALPQLPPPFVIRAIALLTHAGLVVKCISILTCKHVILAIRLTTLSNKNSSYPTSEYLPPICLISEYGNLFRYSYPLTQESRPQLLAIAFAWRLTNPFHKELHTAFHHRQLSVISFQMYSLCSSTLRLNFMVIK